MFSFLAAPLIIFNSLLLNAVVANILSLALLASLTTAIAIAFYKIPYRNSIKYIENSMGFVYSIYRLIDWMSWLMFFFSLIIIVISLLLSFYFVLLPWIIFIIGSTTKCIAFSMTEVVKVVDILPIALHGCISIGIGIVFMWSNLKYSYHSNLTLRGSPAYAPAYAYSHKVLNVIAGTILILAFFIIVICLLLALWSGLMLFNVDILEGFEEVDSKYTYQYSWCK